MMPGFCIVEGLEMWAFRVECLGLEFLGYRLVGEVWVEFRAGISGFGIEGLGLERISVFGFVSFSASKFGVLTLYNDQMG